MTHITASEPISEIDLTRVKNWIDRQDWRWAKTYAKFAPHWYVVKDKIDKSDQMEMNWVVRAIDRHGEPIKFGKRWYIILVIDGYRYWSTGDPYRGKYLINRAKHKNPESYEATVGKEITWMNRLVESIDDWETVPVNEKNYWRTVMAGYNDQHREKAAKIVYTHGKNGLILGKKRKVFYLGGFKYWVGGRELFEDVFQLWRTEP